jgi:hypothetical protein
MRSRAALTAVAAALLALAPVFGTPARAGSLTVAPSDAAGDPAATAPKIVIVVGATEGTTSTYRTMADSIYAEAIKWTPNVVRIYSPNATWAAVKAAAQGASVFVNLGHGNGFESPYGPLRNGDKQDGLGLNEVAGAGDSNVKYYGENYIANEIRFAPNAVVFLNHLCYSAGQGESGQPDPTYPVARERVDNFASGYIRAGARAVVADAYTGVVEAGIRGLFSTHQTFLSLWQTLPAHHGNNSPFTPARNPAFSGVLDPDSPGSGFKKSVVTSASLTTDDVIAGAAMAGTASDPTTLQAPGAASVATSNLPVFGDAGLTTPAGTGLALGAKVQVDQLNAGTTQPDGSTSPTAVQVHTLDAAISGWVDGAGLTPRDSKSPLLWSLDGPRTISRNADGVADSVRFVGRFSESVSWTAQLLDPGGTAVRSFSGSGDQLSLTWDTLVAGAPAPAGTYSWAIHAVDGWGNPALDASGPFDITDGVAPAAGVTAFASASGNPSRATTINFKLVFAADVSGLSAADFIRFGTATSCVVGAPTGSGTTWTVAVSGCSTGMLGLSLRHGSVSGAGGAAGPPSDVDAPLVLIDRTAPYASAPKAGVHQNVALPGNSVPATLTWTGSDAGGAGILRYEIARSLDGAAFALVSTSATSPALDASLTPGHTYRFEVRAVDKAGNRSGWAVGPTLTPALLQQTSTSITWSGAWATETLAADSYGSARTTVAAGASARYTFNGRAIGFVVSRGPGFGVVKVYIDGVYARTVDTWATTDGTRYVAYTKTFSAYGTHTIVLVAQGTAGRPRVTLDAFTIIR